MMIRPIGLRMKVLIIQIMMMVTMMMMVMMMTVMVMIVTMMTSMMKLTIARSRSRLMPRRVKVQARHWSHKQTLESEVIHDRLSDQHL